MLALLLAACGGGGGDGRTSPPVANVVVSGQITFDRVPFKAVLGAGLDFARSVEAPARGVVVEVIDAATEQILAATSTDAHGYYTARVPGDRLVFVRVKAQMIMSGSGASWNFRVLNNVNANALYVLDGSRFNTGGGATRSLRATSGWGGSAYTGVRAAAPFAILDTVYQAKELLLSAQANLAMPALDVYWSASNRPAGPFCPRNGNIVTTSYVPSQTDSCPTPMVVASGIYVLGDFANGAGDTDEFDQHVIAHEFAHYFENMIGRSDSLGGAHGSNARLDLRVAFSEGFGNAFSAMALNDPVYRDSQAGANADFNQNLEASADPNPGWFSETTVQQVLYDVWDDTNEPGDTVTLGFKPIFQTLVGPQRFTLALTGIHVFITGLKASNPSSATAIDWLLNAPPRNITGTGDFAEGETNNGTQPAVLPIYKDLVLNQPTAALCTTAQFGSYNRLANRQYLRLNLPTAANVSITITGVTDGPGTMVAQDPDAFLWRQGMVVWQGLSTTPGAEQTPTPLQLPSGTYVLEVYDFIYANPAAPVTNSTRRCMTVSATG